MSSTAGPNDEVESEKEKHGSGLATSQTSIKARVKRLGITQLGWYAHEKNAPVKIQELITADNAIRVPNMIPLLARASQEDPTVKSTYLCHPSVEHITKQKSEGSFCGYRNIQMMISYIIGSDSADTGTFNNEIPSILRIQEMIEDAWDRGINSEGRLETGGIIGTRKHIGTPDVQTLFKGIGIPCSVGRYVTTSSRSLPMVKTQRNGRKAFDLLLDYVEEYFRSRHNSDNMSKVCMTDTPPIYLQRPHHSMTIVGIEIRSDGKRNLLVLDPQLKPSEKVMDAAEAISKGISVNETTRIDLNAYRRGRWDLGLYKEFETLSLNFSR